MNNFMTYNEASEYLNLKVGTLYCLVSRKQIPHLRLGGRLVRFRRADLDAWLVANTHAVVGSAIQQGGAR